MRYPSITSHPISDSIWLAGRGFLVAAGPDIFLYGEPEAVGDDQTESLFDAVARENAPLDDYHPQMLLQCLLWGAYLYSKSGCALTAFYIGKIELVKTIIIRLALALEAGEQYQRLQVEQFLRMEQDYAPPLVSQCIRTEPLCVDAAICRLQHHQNNTLSCSTVTMAQKTSTSTIVAYRHILTGPAQ